MPPIIKLIIGVVILLVGLFFGLTLEIIGSAVYNNWFPLFSFFFFLISPIPDALCKFLAGKLQQEPFGETSKISTLEHFGTFFTCCLLTIAMWITIILVHSNTIDWRNFLFQLSGGLVILVTFAIIGLLYEIFRQRMENEYGGYETY